MPPCPEQLKLKDDELRRIETPNKKKAPQKDSSLEEVDSDSSTGDLLMSA